MSWVTQRFGDTPAPAAPRRRGGWVESQYGVDDAAPAPPASTGRSWVEDTYGDATEAALTSGDKRPAAAPYPVAPADVFGIPEDAQPSTASSFFSSISDVGADVANLALGPSGGPTSKPGEDREYEASKQRLQGDYQTLQRAVDNNTVTRSIGRAGLETGAFLINAVARGEELLGREESGEVADNINRMLSNLASEDAERNAQSWIAENFGEGTARGVESIIGSGVKGVLGGLAGKVAGSTKAGMMLLFGGSTADQALTELRDEHPDMSEGARVATAVGLGGIEALMMAAGGRIAKSLGLETAEEALFSTQLKPLITNLLTREGVKQGLTQAARAAAGAGIEAAEEGLTQVSQEVWKEALTGENEATALERVAAKLQDPKMWGRAAEAALVGAGARGAFGGANLASQAIERVAQNLPAVVERAVGLARSESGTAGPQGPPDPTQPPSTAAPAASQPAATPTPPESQPSAPAASAGSQAVPPAEPPAPPAPPRRPPSDIEAESWDGRTRIQNATMERIAREDFGRGDVPYSRERRSDRDLARLAINSGLAEPEKALDLAHLVNTTNRQLSDVETMGLNLRVSQLRRQMTTIMQEIGAAQARGDEATAMSLIGTQMRIKDQFNTIHNATVRSGSEQGAGLRARQLAFEDDAEYDALAVLGELRVQKGETPTEAEQKAVLELAEKQRVADENLKRQIEEHNEKAAQEFLRLAKEQKETSQQNEAALYNRLRELMEAACDLE